MSAQTTEVFEWVTRHGIKVAQPVQLSAVPAPAPAKSVPFAEMIACSLCRARVQDMCVTASGATRSPHVQRLVPRCCPCGGSLQRRHTFCVVCRTKRDQESKNRFGRSLNAQRRRERES